MLAVSPESCYACAPPAPLRNFPIPPRVKHSPPVRTPQGESSEIPPHVPASPVKASPGRRGLRLGSRRRRYQCLLRIPAPPSFRSISSVMYLQVSVLSVTVTVFITLQEVTCEVSPGRNTLPSRSRNSPSTWCTPLFFRTGRLGSQWRFWSFGSWGRFPGSIVNAGLCAELRLRNLGASEVAGSPPCIVPSASVLIPSGLSVHRDPSLLSSWRASLPVSWNHLLGGG